MSNLQDRAAQWLKTVDANAPKERWFYVEFSGTSYLTTAKPIERTEGLLRRKPNTEVVAVELDYCDNPKQAVKNLKTIAKFTTHLSDGQALVRELLAEVERLRGVMGKIRAVCSCGFDRNPNMFEHTTECDVTLLRQAFQVAGPAER